jgi:membrane protein
MDTQEPTRIETPGAEPPVTPTEQMRRVFSLQRRQIVQLIMTTVDSWFTHKAPRLGASLAFYTMLSIAPLLIIVVAIAGMFFGREAAEGQLMWQIEDLVGRDGAQTIQTLLKSSYKPAAGTLATILGIVTLFFGATSVVAELRDALNTIWEVPAEDTQTGVQSILSVLWSRTLAFGMVLAVGFLLLVSLAINAAISAIGSYFQLYLPTSEWFLQSADLVFSLGIITFLFAMMFKVLPDIRLDWGDVFLGALFTAVLFTLGKMLIGIYLGKAGVTSAYGAAGSLVLVLLWVYYSAQIFFLGAEFTRAYAQQYGSRPLEHRKRRLLLPNRAPRQDAEPHVTLS